VDIEGPKYGYPATSGGAVDAQLRIGAAGHGDILDIGNINGAWIQARNWNDYTANYSLALNPNGGYVGIGTSTAPPVAVLQIMGKGATPSLSADTEVFYIGIDSSVGLSFGAYPGTPSYNPYIQTKRTFNNGVADGLCINPLGGPVGVGKPTANYQLDVQGDCNITGTYRVNGVAIATGGVTVLVNNTNYGLASAINFFAGGGQQITTGGVAAGQIQLTFAASGCDIQLKRNVQPLVIGGIPVIERLRPITAEWNGLAGTQAGKRLTSVIAQDLQAVIPDAVSPYRAKLRPEDDEDVELLGLEPMAITAHLILAIQQLERRLKTLEQKVN
jgi:hypothetical protein